MVAQSPPPRRQRRVARRNRGEAFVPACRFVDPVSRVLGARPGRLAFRQPIAPGRPIHDRDDARAGVGRDRDFKRVRGDRDD